MELSLRQKKLLAAAARKIVKSDYDAVNADNSKAFCEAVHPVVRDADRRVSDLLHRMASESGGGEESRKGQGAEEDRQESAGETRRKESVETG